MNVLYIEDNIDDLTIIVDVLESYLPEKFGLTAASTLEKGLDCLSNQNIDVILLDLNLPDSFGLDTLKKVLNQSTLVPILVFTGHEDRKLGEEALKLGAQDYLVKGQIEQELLVKAIHYAILRHDLKAQLNAKTEALEKSNKDLEQFALCCAHDLTTPVGNIVSLSEILINHLADNNTEAAMRMAKLISNSGSRMVGLIRSLLAFSRVGNNSLLKRTNLNELFNHILIDMRQLLDENSAEIKVNPLPDTFVYPDEIRSLFMNLLTNSIKYKHPDRNPKISVDCSETEFLIRISVSDNGKGIKPEFVDGVFEMFNRAETRSDIEGHGIGLAHCKKIVDLHQGKIYLESQFSQGTTFFVELPKNLDSEHFKGPNGNTVKAQSDHL